MSPRLRCDGVPPHQAHPDDLELDWESLQIRINGPQSEIEQAEWAAMHALRAATLEKIAERRNIAQADGREVDEDDIAALQLIIDRVDASFPSASVRRQAGFDLEAWRERHLRAVRRAEEALSPTGRRARQRWRRTLNPNPDGVASDQHS